MKSFKETLQERQRNKEIREKEIEDMIKKRFSEERAEIDRFSSELKEKEEMLLEKEKQLDAEFAAKEEKVKSDFEEKERLLRLDLEEREEKLKRQKSAMDEDIKKRAKEIAEQIKNLTSQRETALKDIDKYRQALYSTETTITSWLKRADRKEAALFEEIQAGFDLFQKYNKTVQEEGFEFEQYFAGLLKLNGYSDVEVTQKSQDYGADVLAYKDGLKYVFQCKYYTNQVGIEAVQQAVGAKVHYFAHVAVVATNSVFTVAAKTLAKESGVILWDCEKIALLSAKTPDDL